MAELLENHVQINDHAIVVIGEKVSKQAKRTLDDWLYEECEKLTNDEESRDELIRVSKLELKKLL